MTRFLHHYIKQGGQITGREFCVCCEKCGTKSTYRTSKPMPDEPIRKRFSDQGWLLGRTAVHDLCPSCLHVQPENRLAARYKTTRDGAPVPTPRELAESAFTQRQEDTAKAHQALDRFVRPITAQQEEAIVQPVLVQTGLTLDQTLALSRSLDGIAGALQALASQMGDMAASQQLLAEENARMRAAVAQIVPAITRQTDALAFALDRVRDATERQAAPEAAPAPEPMRERVMELVREIIAEGEAVEAALAGGPSDAEPTATATQDADAEAVERRKQPPTASAAEPRGRFTPEGIARLQEAGQRSAAERVAKTTPEQRSAAAHKAVATRNARKAARQAQSRQEQR